MIYLTRITLDHDIILPMFIQKVHHKLVPLDDPLYNPYLPLIIVKYVDPVSHLESLPPILDHLRRLRNDPTSFELIAGPLVSEPHLHHKHIAIFYYEFFQCHL